MNPAPAHAFDDLIVVNVDLDHIVQRHTVGLQRLRLGNGAREPVEEKTVFAVILGNALLHQAQNDIV